MVRRRASPRQRAIRGAVFGLSSVLALAAQLAGAHRALASPNYPAILDRHAEVECADPLTRCLICHVTAAGGEGTAKQPFAVALVEDFGFSGGKAGRELAQLLDEVPEELDTDGDGESDQAELRACHNPSGGDLSDGPGYGCEVAQVGALAARSPHGPSARAAGAWAVFGLGCLMALGLVRRRAA